MYLITAKEKTPDLRGQNTFGSSSTFELEPSPVGAFSLVKAEHGGNRFGSLNRKGLEPIGLRYQLSLL